MKTLNRYTEAVNYLAQYVENTAKDLCENNQKLLDIPSKLDYCLDVLKSNENYLGD